MTIVQENDLRFRKSGLYFPSWYGMNNILFWEDKETQRVFLDESKHL